MLETLGGIGGVRQVLVGGEFGRIGIQTGPIGSNQGDIRDAADRSPGKVRAAFAVACGAITLVQRLSLLSQRRVDLLARERNGFRLMAQPVRRAVHRLTIQSGWPGPGAKGRTAVSLLDGGVVSIPMKLHPFAL